MPQARESNQLEPGEQALAKTRDLKTYCRGRLVKYVGCYVGEKGELIRKAGEYRIQYTG